MSGDGDTVDVELVDEHLGESVLGEGPVEPGQLVEGLHQAGGAEDDSDDQPQLDGEEEEVPGTSAVLVDGQYLICSYITVYTVY